MVRAVPRKVALPATLVASARAAPRGPDTACSNLTAGATWAVTRNMAGPAAIVASALRPARTPCGAVTRDVADLTAVVARAAVGAVALHHHLIAAVRALTGYVPWTATPEAVVAVRYAWGQAEWSAQAANTTANGAAHPCRARAHTREVAHLPAEVALPIAVGAIPCDVADVAA